MLKDTQSERDHRRIPIDRVGVKSLRYPMQVRDKHHAGQSTVATLQMTVDLPHHFKGTHMSRFIEVLAEHDGIPVLVRDGTCTVAAFHPELTHDTRLHELFVAQLTGN